MAEESSKSYAAKPIPFDGTDRSYSTVSQWAFNVQEYVELADIAEAKQTRVAAMFLRGYRQDLVYHQPFPSTARPH